MILKKHENITTLFLPENIDTKVCGHKYRITTHATEIIRIVFTPKFSHYFRHFSSKYKLTTVYKRKFICCGHSHLSNKLLYSEYVDVDLFTKSMFFIFNWCYSLRKVWALWTWRETELYLLFQWSQNQPK